MLRVVFNLRIQKHAVSLATYSFCNHLVDTCLRLKCPHVHTGGIGVHGQFNGFLLKPQPMHRFTIAVRHMSNVSCVVPILDSLTLEQRNAVDCTEQPIIVFAGPGTGISIYN